MDNDVRNALVAIIGALELIADGVTTMANPDDTYVFECGFIDRNTFQRCSNKTAEPDAYFCPEHFEQWKKERADRASAEQAAPKKKCPAIDGHTDSQCGRPMTKSGFCDRHTITKR